MSTWEEERQKTRAEGYAREAKQMDDFVPEAMATWATFVPARDYPRFKFHKGRGQARGALGIRHWRGGGVRGGLIFNLVEGEWKVVERVEPGTKKDQVPWRARG